MIVCHIIQLSGSKMLHSNVRQYKGAHQECESDSIVDFNQIEDDEEILRHTLIRTRNMERKITIPMKPKITKATAQPKPSAARKRLLKAERKYA